MKISFGIQLEPQFGYEKKDLDTLGKFVSESAFDMIWLSDHMFLNSEAVNISAFDCFTAMTYLLTKFTNIRVGSLVLCNNYRHPSILAKMTASLDQLSQGRLEVGIGAGWKKIEYDAYGIPFPSLKVRLEQMEEGINVLFEMWSEKEYSTYTGKHYSVNNALCYPKPYQSPHPPLWIGSMKGGKKITDIAAKYSNGFNLAWSFSNEELETIFRRLDENCVKYKRSPSEIKRSLGLWVNIFDTEEEMDEQFKSDAIKRNMSFEEFKKMRMNSLYGTKEQIIERLQYFKTLNISNLIFMFPYQKEIEYMQIMNDEIFSHLD